MNDLEYVVKQLDGMNLSKIGREINMHYSTIYNVAKQRVTNPKVRTIQKISQYLKEKHARQDKD